MAGQQHRAALSDGREDVSREQLEGLALRGGVVVAAVNTTTRSCRGTTKTYWPRSRWRTRCRAAPRESRRPPATTDSRSAGRRLACARPPSARSRPLARALGRPTAPLEHQLADLRHVAGAWPPVSVWRPWSNIAQRGPTTPEGRTGTLRAVDSGKLILKEVEALRREVKVVCVIRVSHTVFYRVERFWRLFSSRNLCGINTLQGRESRPPRQSSVRAIFDRHRIELSAGRPPNCRLSQSARHGGSCRGSPTSRPIGARGPVGRRRS